MDTEQSKYEGYAILELMGHRKEVGYVTTEYFGGAALFRVDTPTIEAHEETTKRAGYASTDQGHMHLPAGSVVRRPAIPSRTVYVAPGSLYALNPCTEEVVRAAAQEKAYGTAPLQLLSMPEALAIAAAPGYEDSDPDDNASF